MKGRRVTGEQAPHVCLCLVMQGVGSEEGGLYSARSQDFGPRDFAGLPGAQPPAPAAPTGGAGPSGGYQHPGPLHRQRGGAAPLPRVGTRMQPTQPPISAVQRQAQQRHFQHLGRLASMQSAQVPLLTAVALLPGPSTIIQ